MEAEFRDLLEPPPEPQAPASTINNLLSVQPTQYVSQMPDEYVA